MNNKFNFFVSIVLTTLSFTAFQSCNKSDLCVCYSITDINAKNNSRILGKGDYTFEDCEGSLYDSGGWDGAYGNNESITETYCSTNDSCSNGVFYIQFASFDTEANFDILSIYDGPTATSSNLIGQFSGSNLPPTLFSTSGCFTFRWQSDGSSTESGWTAKINGNYAQGSVFSDKLFCRSDYETAEEFDSYVKFYRDFNANSVSNGSGEVFNIEQLPCSLK